MPRAVVFEDDDEKYGQLEAALRPKLGDLGVTLQRYPGHEQWDAIKTKPIGRTVTDSMMEPEPASLVIVDWDLTRYKHPVTPELVTGLSDELGLPFCVYQTVHGPVEYAKRLQRWQESGISIDSFLPHDEIARRCLSLLSGFMRIGDAFSNRGEGDLSDVIRALLKPPQGADVNLDQYAWGRLKALQVAERGDDKLRFATTTTGYWIYNHLLQFPGVLLNAVATASYLNIDHETFRSDAALQGVFNDALYTGPFSEMEPFWWASALDDIRASRSGEGTRTLKNGLEIAREAGHNVGPVRCAHDHEGAGYYCVITRAPVCAEHSASPGGWLPMGADRCRIEQDKFDELSAWLAI